MSIVKSADSPLGYYLGTEAEFFYFQACFTSTFSRMSADFLSVDSRAVRYIPGKRCIVPESRILGFRRKALLQNAPAPGVLFNQFPFYGCTENRRKGVFCLGNRAFGIPARLAVLSGSILGQRGKVGSENGGL